MAGHLGAVEVKRVAKRRKKHELGNGIWFLFSLKLWGARVRDGFRLDVCNHCLLGVGCWFIYFSFPKRLKVQAERIFFFFFFNGIGYGLVVIQGKGCVCVYIYVHTSIHKVRVYQEAGYRDPTGFNGINNWAFKFHCWGCLCSCSFCMFGKFWQRAGFHSQRLSIAWPLREGVDVRKFLTWPRLLMEDELGTLLGLGQAKQQYSRLQRWAGVVL